MSLMIRRRTICLLDPEREFRAGQEKEVLYVLFLVNDGGAVSEAGS